MPGAARSADLLRSTLADLGANQRSGGRRGLPPAVTHRSNRSVFRNATRAGMGASWALARSGFFCLGGCVPASTFRKSYAWAVRSTVSWVLDGELLSGSLAIEASSLLWSGDGGRLAAQELV